MRGSKAAALTLSQRHGGATGEGSELQWPRALYPAVGEAQEVVGNGVSLQGSPLSRPGIPLASDSRRVRPFSPLETPVVSLRCKARGSPHSASQAAFLQGLLWGGGEQKPPCAEGRASQAG